MIKAKRTKDVLLILGLSETMGHLALANSVCWFVMCCGWRMVTSEEGH